MKVAALRTLDSVSLVIVAFVSPRKLSISYGRSLFGVLLGQAVIASQAIVEVISKSVEINSVNLSSSVDQ